MSLRWWCHPQTISSRFEPIKEISSHLSHMHHIGNVFRVPIIYSRGESARVLNNPPNLLALPGIFWNTATRKTRCLIPVIGRTLLKSSEFRVNIPTKSRSLRPYRSILTSSSHSWFTTFFPSFLPFNVSYYYPSNGWQHHQLSCDFRTTFKVAQERAWWRGILNFWKLMYVTTFWVASTYEFTLVSNALPWQNLGSVFHRNGCLLPRTKWHTKNEAS